MHLNDEVTELCYAKVASPVLYLGGGTTGLQAVCDVACHHGLSQSYKKIEASDQLRELVRRPNKVPSWTKSDVVRRGLPAWKQQDHNKMELAHKQLGYTTAVDGSEDHLIH